MRSSIMAAMSAPATTRSRLRLVAVLLAVTPLLPSGHGGGAAAAPAAPVAPFGRRSFPEGFIFGAASSAYQYEGAAKEGGRGPSIWDTFTHQHPDKITDHSNGDVANDQYHRYKEDVGIMKDMGLDAYRFSISWTRILPNGKISGGVNKEGVQYYNNLINELLSKGIQPFVTIFHWDSPQSLEDEYSGFLSPRIVDDFVAYADRCFELFGDRVKHWITFNEPWTFSSGGYTGGQFAPGRCSPWAGSCPAGDSGTEPYTVAHHQLLAHAAAVHLYKRKYQASQQGKIGITLVSHWFIPYNKGRANDDMAAQRSIDFMLGWFMDPLINGEYPKTMLSIVGDRLPRFSPQESKLVKGSFDFIGLNYYTTYYVLPLPPANNMHPDYDTDSQSNLTVVKNGKLIGPQAASSWLFIYPPGIRDLLVYVKKRWHNPTIYITENGVDEANNRTLTLEEALQDDTRIKYYYEHLLFLRRAIIRDGVNVKGYFAWSLLDNFEWSSGYTVRFGINYVDYSNLKRYPKKSAHWFKDFLKK